MGTASRRYWHKDAKWIFGILFVFSFGPALLAGNLVWLTEEERAIDLNAAFLATAFSREGLNDTSDIESVRKDLIRSGDKKFQPIPELKIYITLEEIDAALKSGSPRQARIDFFKKFSRPLYLEGVEGLAALTDNPEFSEKIVSGAGLLGIISYKNHLLLRNIFAVLAAVSAVSAILLVFYCSGFGRLTGPGLAIIISTLPWFALVSLLSIGFEQKRAEDRAIGQETDMMGQIFNVGANALVEPMKAIFGRYLFVMMIGVGLILLAVLGKIITSIVKRPLATKG